MEEIMINSKGSLILLFILSIAVFPFTVFAQNEGDLYVGTLHDAVGGGEIGRAHV